MGLGGHWLAAAGLITCVAVLILGFGWRLRIDPHGYLAQRTWFGIPVLWHRFSPAAVVEIAESGGHLEPIVLSELEATEREFAFGVAASAQELLRTIQESARCHHHSTPPAQGAYR